MDRALNSGPAVLVAVALVLLTPAAGSAQSAQPIEGFWVPNDAVTTIEADNAGRVYLGGKFDTIGPYTGTSVRLDAATAALSMSSLSDGTVYAVAPDGAGGWYLGGNFTRVRGYPRQRLAHVLADGRVAEWNPGTDYAVYALAVADGVVYVGGQFYQIAGQSRSYFASLDAATGALVGPSFSPAIPDFVYTFAVSGNTLYVGGAYFVSSYDRSTGYRIRSLPAMASNHAIVPVGSTVYLGGGATLTSGGVRSVNATSGATNWTTVTNGTVRTLAVVGSQVYFGGVFTTVGASLTPRDTLAAVRTSDGSVTSWDPNSAGGVGGVVYALVAQGTTLYVGGDFRAVGGATRYNLGAVDTTSDTDNALAWNPRVNGRVWRLALDGQHLFAGGDLSSAGGTDRNALAALDATTGALVDSWNPDPHYQSGSAGSTVNALSLSPSGTLYVAGGFNVLGGVYPSQWLGALDYDGNGVSGFNARSDGTVAALATSPTSLYVSGQFSSIGGALRPRLAALDTATGNLRTAWNAGASGQQVGALAVESGLVYAGGSFTNIGGGARLVGLDPVSGARDTTFDPRMSGSVSALGLQGSTLYAGGLFTSVNVPALTRNRMAGLDVVSGAADSFDPNVSHTSTPYVYAIAPWGPTIFAGGVFTTIGGQSRYNLAALDSSIGTATSWNPGIATEVRALKIAHNMLYVGGDTSGGAGQYRRGFLAFCLVRPASALVATPAGPNRIDLSWAGSGAPGYEVGRSRQPGGPYEAIATVAGNTYSDTAAEGGLTYYYVVRAKNLCLSDPSAEASAQTGGSCTLGPGFEGLAWARAAATAGCAVELGWLEADAACGDAVSYTVYRDTVPGFTPQDSNRVAAGLSTTTYTDASALAPGISYYYVVRARALASGIEDANTIAMSALPSSCSATAPAPPRVLTVRAGDGENTVEWLNPGGPAAGVRFCAKDGSVPSGPTDGDCSDLAAVPFERGSFTEPVPNGTTRYYAVWADAGGGSYSAPVSSWGRPQSSSGGFRWAYTTAATTLAPVGLYPGLGYFAASNDKIVHRMAGTGAGGGWPLGWAPPTINAAGAWRPLVVRFANPTVKGSKDVVFVAAQDGHVYAIDAGSGVHLWASPQLGGTGGSILGSPAATFSDYGAAFDMLVVSARTSAGNGIVYGIHLSDGSIAWTFNNGGGANAMGLISGTPQVELTSPPRVYFTSRRAAGGSADTAWCLSFSETSATKEWSVDVGEADAGPTLGNGKLYVGTLDGDVQALWPADGGVAWTWSTGDQAVKAYVWVSGSRLFFSTLTQVHGIVDEGASASPLWTGGAASATGAVTLGHPSALLVRDGRVYVGSDDGRLYSIDATTDTPAAPTYVDLGDPSVPKVIGPPAHDVFSNLLLSGSDQGVVYAVARPF